MLKTIAALPALPFPKIYLPASVLGSTGLGHGVAVPHGRIKGLKNPIAAFVRLQEAIPFESPDGQAVSLLIFLLMPDNVTQQHLEIFV